VGNNGTITPLALTVSGSSVATKTYDGTTAATITGGVLNGVVSADQAYVSLATQGGTFASKNAGDAVPVTAFDTLTVTGPLAGDYTLTEPTGLTGTITPLALNVSGSSVTPKTYDGTTAATITGGFLNGVLSADQANVALTQSGSFATKNAGTGIPVAATDTLVLTGSAAGDYTLTEPTGLTGTITPRPVSLSNAETAAAKTYDGTTVATLSGGALSNVVAGDTDGLSLIGTFATPNAGQNIAVTVTLSGADAGNYVLAGAPSLAANIYPAPLVGTANPLATPLGAVLPAFTGTFSGFVDGQTLAALEADGYQARWSSSVSNTSAPGRYAITGSFNDYNYSVVQAAANATAFDATLPTSSAGPFLGIALYSLGSLQAANGTATSGTAVGGSAAGATAVDGASASSAAASSAMVNSAGVGGASGASLGTAGSDASAEGMSASTVNGGGLTLGANATSTASDGTVTLVAVADGSASAGEVSAGAVGGSDTPPPAQSEGSTATGMKNEWRRAFGVPLLVVRGGMNTSLVH
jgi:hypothetical protein